jgi:uncharacterized phage-associated protein
MFCRIPPIWKLRSTQAYPYKWMAEPSYNPEKFKELLIYIASRTEGDQACGDMKLNKLLYFADVTAFRRTGQPISGATYQHEERGPIARALLKARRDLEGQRRLRTCEREYGGFPQTATEATDEVRPGVLSAEEIAIADEVIERFKDFDGGAMETIAHEEPGWRMTKDGERIPYRLSLLAKRASPGAITRGRELAERFGW